MKDKIQVGEYIRTYNGIIGRILEDEDIAENGVYIDITFFDDYADETNFVKYEDIKSHSFNIIDLLKVEDIIKMKDNDMNYLETIYINDEGMLEAVKEDSEYNNMKIISIVTKEQFKNVEYEV